jgi:hypothetical protein
MLSTFADSVIHIRQQLCRRTAFPLKALAIFSFFTPLPNVPINWKSIFIPRNVFAFVLVLLGGFTCEELLAKGLKLLFEIAETKPWRMGHSFGYNEGAQGKNGTDKNLGFLTVEVTTNLALALTHLRREKGVRTLWIDALCLYLDRR